MKTRIPSIAFLWGLVFCLLTPAGAQVVLDGTVGPTGEKALSGPDYEIKESYGERAGSNLFHSLKTFNIDVGETADFSVSSDINNIVARITGGAARVDGTIEATLLRNNQISNANLFLLNSAGMVFGPNARLNLGGSFHVSTADYLKLEERGEDGGKFHSRPFQKDELSVASPAAFGFDSDMPPAGIALEGGAVDPSISKAASGLRVKKGNTLSLVGGNIDIQGTYGDGSAENQGSRLRVAAPSGRINIVAAAPSGEIDLAPSSERAQVTANAGDVHLQKGAMLSVSGNGSGDIYIRGGAFIQDNSALLADNYSDEDGGKIHIEANTIELQTAEIYSDTQNESLIAEKLDADGTVARGLDYTGGGPDIEFDPVIGTGKGGDIFLHAADSIVIGNYTTILAESQYSGSPGDDIGHAGNITMDAKSISISTGSWISSDTFGAGNGGQIGLRATESVEIKDPGTTIFSGAMGETENAGDGGNISIQAPHFAMSDEATINADTGQRGSDQSAGRGGDVLVTGLGDGPAETIDVSNSRIFAGAVDGKGNVAGDGGSVLLKGLEIRFTEGGRIGSESLGAGRGGDVTLDASGGTVRFSGANSNGEFSRVQTTAESELSDAGNAGNIVVRGNDVIFENGGSIAASTSGPGNAGAIEVSAAEQLRIHSGGAIASSSDSVDAGGNAGRIAIEAGSVELTGGDSTISTETQSLASVIDGQPFGNAGNIQLTTDSLNIADGASITSATRNDGKGGNAGTIIVNNSELLALSGYGSAISTETQSLASVFNEQPFGQAGNIQLTTGRLDIARGASVSSASRNPGAAGDAGTVTISASGDIVLTRNGEITTEALNAGGGRMYVTSGDMLYLEDSRITTSVQKGAENGGDIDAVARFIVLRNGQIIAKAFEGRGGNIRIAADQFITDPGSIVSASSELGIDGDIFIESPVTDISSFLAVLPDQFLDAGQWIVKSCAEQAVEAASRFIVKEREGAPAPVDDWLASPF